MIILYGLPGQWMHWTLQTIVGIDEDVTDSDLNFLNTIGDRERYQFDIIPKTDLPLERIVRGPNHIVQYTLPKNFPWYLHTFFEKVDEFYIRTEQEHFLNDLKSKGNGKTGAGIAPFQVFLNHLLATYDNEPDTNSVIEYFATTCVDNDWQRAAEYCPDPTYGIEFSEYANPAGLFKRLNEFGTVDREFFDHRYRLLLKRNKRYFVMASNFEERLKHKLLNEMSVIELGYVGSLVYTINNADFDWYREDFRVESVNQYHTQLLELLHD